VVEGEGWVLHVDPGIRAPQLARFVAELDLRTAQLTRFFGRAPSAPIHVWLYANEGQKRALMGASGTQLARPWSREIHVDGFDVPHGVLKHELAHIFAADLADGPLHVPARFGLWPNMVLIEGLAVAADWPARGLTVHQWTRAMRALGLAPDLAESLGPTGFWRAPGPRGYTVAGSFIRHLVDTRGVAPLAAAYASGDLEAAYGAPLQALLDEWAHMIDALPLGDDERALAEHRFRAGSIFPRACARSMGSKVREAERALARGALDEGRAAIESILALDSGRVDLGMSYARALSSAGADADARAWLAALAARPGVTRRARAQLRELDGDLAWRAGALDDARARFRGVLAERFGEDVDRLQQVKLAAIDALGTATTATTAVVARRYLTGELGVDRAAPLLAAVDARAADDALAAYLLAKAYEQLGLDAEAEATARRALTLRLPSAAVRREAELVVGRAAWRAGHAEASAAAFERVVATSTQAARRLDALDWAERARRGAPMPPGAARTGPRSP
jgi:tetratricopeptide (TPR) repeat protein